MNMQTEAIGNGGNLVYNHNFFYYFNTAMEGDRVVYNHPHGWKHEDAGNRGLITFNLAENCCEIRKSKGYRQMSLSQEITAFSEWRYGQAEKVFVANAFLVTPGPACELTFSLASRTRTKSRFVTLHPNEKQRIKLRMHAGTDPGEIKVSIESATPNAVIYIYSVNVYAVR